ncbi:hypothetical protein ABBQ38_006749 [Trebouxia sp. C0009 RCD-2024]
MYKCKSFLLLLATVAVCYARKLDEQDILHTMQNILKKSEKEVNNRPLIGVLSQPGEPAPEGMSYIAASYVKFVEMAGGRAVPIEYDLPQSEVKKRFDAINGLLVPGGSGNLTKGHPFYDNTEYLLKLAIEANDNGDYFPVHGTCLGLEVLSIIAAQNATLLSKFNAEDNASPLYLTEAAEKSKFFKSLGNKVKRSLQEKPLAMENHSNGVRWSSYGENPLLQDFFKVLSLSADRDERIYISTIEAHKYPVTATQWHPEKNVFEWATHLHVPHSFEAIQVTAAVANFLVSEARRNFHEPANLLQEQDLMMYNFCPVYTGKEKHEGEEVDFDQAYFFPEWKEPSAHEADPAQSDFEIELRLAASAA